MFGIGFWEMLMIGGLVLIAVGPERLPSMIKSVAKVYRQMRRAALDIRQSTGIDDVLRDEELKELANLRHQKIQLMDAAKKPAAAAAKPVAGAVTKPVAPEGVVAKGSLEKPGLEKPGFEKPGFDKAAFDKTAAMGKPIVPQLGSAQRPEPLRGVSLEDRRREMPLEGVDVAYARARLAPPLSDLPATRDGTESAA
jgi:sec-independent protein translocase protein TatB